MNKQKVNVRVEFESRPIRHIAVQCPNCQSWFSAYDISKKDLDYDYQLYHMNCECPKCDYDFEGTAEVQECDSSEEVYKGILKRKVEWS